MIFPITQNLIKFVLSFYFDFQYKIYGNLNNSGYSNNNFKKGLISRSVGKFQIISKGLELTVRGADKPCLDCVGSVCLGKKMWARNTPRPD